MGFFFCNEMHQKSSVAMSLRSWIQNHLSLLVKGSLERSLEAMALSTESKPESLFGVGRVLELPILPWGFWRSGFEAKASLLIDKAWTKEA